MTLKQKMYKLEKLKEERDRINKTPRWGVKSREINLPTYFQNLKEICLFNVFLKKIFPRRNKQNKL